MKNDKEIIKETEINQIKFYYKSLPIIGNVFTACILLSADKKILSRGIAICSPLDQHNKLIARRISKNRALKAYFTKSSAEVIKIKDDIFQYTIKQFKIRNNNEKDEMIKYADKFNFSYKIRKITKCDKIEIYIPYSFNNYFLLNNNYFNYKSEFLPKPTAEEVSIFNL